MTIAIQSLQSLSSNGINLVAYNVAVKISGIMWYNNLTFKRINKLIRYVNKLCGGS